MTEDFLTLYADPGEDFGWALGCGTLLLARGTHKMWTMSDIVEDALKDGPSSSELWDEVYWRDGIDAEKYEGLPIGRIVCENWRIYPWKVKELAWDECRTARVIGALTDKCRRYDIPFITQAAAIKDAAQAAGAEEYYDYPVTENRHQNDAIQHYVFYTLTEMMGLKLVVPEDTK